MGGLVEKLILHCQACNLPTEYVRIINKVGALLGSSLKWFVLTNSTLQHAHSQIPTLTNAKYEGWDLEFVTVGGRGATNIRSAQIPSKCVLSTSSALVAAVGGEGEGGGGAPYLLIRITATTEE